jgi:hypothetical protein
VGVGVGVPTVPGVASVAVIVGVAVAAAPIVGRTAGVVAGGVSGEASGTVAVNVSVAVAVGTVRSSGGSVASGEPATTVSITPPSPKNGFGSTIWSTARNQTLASGGALPQPAGPL